MGKHFCYLVLVVAGLLVLSCNPNDDNSSDNNSNNGFAENFGSAVSRDFIGQIVNENNQPLQGVSVKIGTSTVQTDVNGVFIINNANVYQRFAYITAKKSGYIDGSRAMVPTSGKNNVKIMLISNTPVQTIQSGVASEVTLPNGTKVNFDGAFQDEDGAAYSGSVQVTMYHLEASNENISSLMPGMFYAADANGEEKVLETYGMMNVELKGSGGQKLQIASGHTAQISMAIDNTQLATAPNSIPLWHFDEVNGYWKEEGSAQRVGNNYVGTVSHFSWWNCDVPFPTVSLTVNITDNNGNPLSNVHVSIVSSSALGGVFVYGYSRTNDSGQVSGLVPSNEILAVFVFGSSFECISSYNVSIGPFSSDTILPTIVLGNSGVETAQIQGTLKKCNNSNVTNGYVLIYKNNNPHATLIPVNNGDFNSNIAFCSNNSDFTLKGVDYENNVETTISNHTFISPITNIGSINACTVINEYISYQIDNGETKILTENLQGGTFQPYGAPNELHISGNDGNGIGLNISGYNNIPGTYTTETFGYSISSTETSYIDYSVSNTITFNLTHFGQFGDYIDMTFSGTYTNNTGTHSISGVVHVIRDN